MSTAFFPQSMKSYNNYVNGNNYVPPKVSTPPFSNKTAITYGNVRPFTNKDYTNYSYSNFIYNKNIPSDPTKYTGLSRPEAPRRPRPLKHYRKGYSINNRYVDSSTGGSLIKQTIDNPGSYTVKSYDQSGNIANCTCTGNTCNCNGIHLVNGLKPTTSLTDKPNNYLVDNPTNQVQTCTPTFCHNPEKNALTRVRSSGNTIVKKNYYTTTYQYLQNRCQTFDQKQFNFLNTGNPVSKPGGPLSQNNTYYSNCFPNCDGFCNEPNCTKCCKLSVYKPNNYQFATQGAVSSSTRTLKLIVDNINTNYVANKDESNYNNTIQCSTLIYPNHVNPFIYKIKVEPYGQNYCIPASKKTYVLFSKSGLSSGK
jgi:hypothetical protein